MPGTFIRSEIPLATLLSEQRAKIGIIGLGYVGIPLLLSFFEAGYTVIGFDIDPGRIEELNEGRSPIRHIPAARIARMLDAGFHATSNFSRIGDVDAIIICVPTPLNKYREPDLSFITATMDAIAPHLRQEQILSLESTTWPGTTEEVLKPYVERAGLRVGDNFFLVYSPEREDPGNRDFETRSIPKIVGGSTEACLHHGSLLYGRIIERVVRVSSTQTAELTKLCENIHRAVNIGLVNELKLVADEMGIDIFEVIDAAATKPFGFVPYYPGPGIGGHCIPIDPFYLTWKAREFGLHTRFVELAGEINNQMPQRVVEKLALALNRAGKSLKSARLLVLGLAYKKNVDDVRESPSVTVMDILRRWDAIVDYHDPYVPVFPRMRKYDFALKSVPLTRECIESYDALLLLTDHDDFDYDFIGKHASLIIDTRGRYRGVAENVVRA